MNCQLSKLVVVLPRDPSAVTSHVIAGIQAGISGLGLPQEALVCVRNLANATQLKPIDLSKIASEISFETEQFEYCSPEPQVVLSQLLIHGVRWVIFLGGKKEAQTAWELSEEAAALSVDIGFALIPDDFTNSLPATDHCLGYGSFALSFCDLIAGDDLDNYSFFRGVKLLIAPGSENGWTAAAAGLASALHTAKNTIPDAGPHVICVPEIRFCENEFRRQVNSALEQYSRATVVVSKSIVRKLPAVDCSQRISALDGLRLSEYLMATLRRELDEYKELIDIKIKARIHEFRTKSFMGKYSETDASEAFNAGVVVIKMLLERSIGAFMLGLKRGHGIQYSCDFVPVELQTALFFSRPLPESMFPTNRNVVSPEFLSYVLPLVGANVPSGDHCADSFSTALSAAIRRVNGFANSRRFPKAIQL